MEADANTAKLTRLEKKSKSSVQNKPEYKLRHTEPKSNKQIHKRSTSAEPFRT
jgi:hypothetical protein